MSKKITFIKLAEQTLLEAKVPLSPPEIWIRAQQLGIAAEIKSAGKTPQNSIGAQLYVDVRDNPSSAFVQVSKRPSKFGLKSLKYQASKKSETADATELKSIGGKSKIGERELHPLLVKFAYSNQHFKAHLKTILHENSSKAKKGFNKWLHPDIVGAYFPFKDYEKNTLFLQKHLLINSIKLFSFELKISLSILNLREYYFQAVSNSSWANEGYLVVLDIEEDESLFDEIRRLNNSFGIGLIKLNPNDIYSSEILFPSRISNKIDWDTIDRLASENPIFSQFIKDISDDIRVEQVKSIYDPVLSDEEFEKLISSKF